MPTQGQPYPRALLLTNGSESLAPFKFQDSHPDPPGLSFLPVVASLFLPSYQPLPAAQPTSRHIPRSPTLTRLTFTPLIDETPPDFRHRCPPAHLPARPPRPALPIVPKSPQSAAAGCRLIALDSGWPAKGGFARMHQCRIASDRAWVQPWQHRLY
jgi:hypothetical protein